MKAKKYRRCEHHMLTVYEKGFGLRQPYQFLVDGDFCRSSLQHKFDPKERLPYILAGACRLLVTNCVMHALRQAARASEDPVVTGAPFVARRLELRRCRHDEPKSVIDCFLDLIGKDNPFHYGVASANDGLKGEIRKVPGVPIVYMERVFPLLEAPTALSLSIMNKREKAKLHVNPIEAAIIKKELGDITKPNLSPKHKKKKIKGPNPLSVKKSTKDQCRSSEKASKKRRQRKKPASTATAP